MFANRSVSAMLPAKDLARAKSWYAKKLGIEPSETSDYGASYSFGGVSAYMYKSEFAGTAQHTLFSFTSTDVEADMRELRAKGVVFLDYDLPGLKTVDGLATFGPVKNAWVKDSEGNILGFVEGM